jgi:IclR family transcriptional regulator, KDG regulon repressor
MSNGGESSTRPYVAQSLERGLQAMALLRDSPRGELDLGDLARQLSLHKSTVHRLLRTLLRYDYIAQDPATRRYRLGLVFLEFAHHTLERLDVRRYALRPMQALAGDSGESVYLNVLAGARALCVDEVVGPHGVTVGSNVGAALRVHAAAAGKCFLTWLPEDERTALLSRAPLDGVTAHTITERTALLAEMERVRVRGYAVNDEEGELGVRFVAAPIFDQDGRIVASLALGAPVLRVGEGDLPRLGAAVSATAGKISAMLGHRGASPRGEPDQQEAAS